MQVLKRNGSLEPFDANKIITAILKAGFQGDVDIFIKNVISDIGGRYNKEFIKVDDLHSTVEAYLYGNSAKDYRNYRTQRVIARGYTKVGKSALSEYILHSKYAHPGENWSDVVNRVLRMHRDRLKLPDKEVKRVAEALSAKRVLPSMRSLQFGGEAILKNHARLYNCSFSLCDRERFFQETFFLLLSGCGVGYSVSKRYVKKLPKVHVDDTVVRTHRVADTIEGWADAAGYLVHGSFNGMYVEFDYSDIRPRGSLLRTTKGVAPGHIPLKKSLENVRSVLLAANGRNLTPFECHRIVCYLAEGVLSGGIRRSSLICLFDEQDQEMMNCKRGTWYNTHPELRLSNNSVTLLPNSNLTADFWREMVEAMMEFGEPGYFFTREPHYGTNPCGEIGLNPVSEKFGTGFAFCNLTEVNVAACETVEDFYQACEIATTIGTWQASYTDFHYLTEASIDVAKRDALLGVSLTGIQEAKFELTDEILRDCAENIRIRNLYVSADININPAQRITCVKPSGTASLFLETTPGIHPAHAKWFFRRVTANANEPVFQEFLKANPHMCEKKPDGDWVITFPIWSDGKTRSDVKAVDLMNEVKRFYENWIIPAKRGENDLSLNHNVSCTITVTREERDEVRKWLERDYESVQAMSFLPDYGDIVYPFAPFQEVRSVTDMAKWIELAKWYKHVDYKNVGVTEFGAACEGPSCEI